MFLSIEIDDGRQLLINLAKVIAIERKDDRPLITMDWSHASAKCTIAGPWRHRMQVVNYSYEELVELLAPKAIVPTEKRGVPAFPKGHWRFSEQEALEKMIAPFP